MVVPKRDKILLLGNVPSQVLDTAIRKHLETFMDYAGSLQFSLI